MSHHFANRPNANSTCCFHRFRFGSPLRSSFKGNQRFRRIVIRYFSYLPFPYCSLFPGSECSCATDVYDDHKESFVNEETVTLVTNVILSVGICSFYDGAGRINDDQLESFTAQFRDPIIGWCCFNPVDNEPSITQQRVSHSLSKTTLFETSPRLFVMLHRFREHHNATITMKYEAFISAEVTEFPELSHKTHVIQNRMMVPIPVQIQNIGDHRGIDRYSSTLPSSFGFLSSAADSTNETLSLISRVEDAYLEPQDIQIRQLERQCQELKEEFEKQVSVVKQGTQEVNRKREFLERLKAATNQVSMP